MNLSGAAFLWLLALGLGIMTFRRDPGAALGAMRRAGGRVIEVLPRIAVALVAAGFLAQLVPTEAIGALIGQESGWRGILIASLVGGFVPAGPIISFPIVVVLYKAGAGVPQLVAFLTAWSVFAFHRILIYESSLMGWRFSAVRLASSLVLPPLSGFLALALAGLFPHAG